MSNLIQIYEEREGEIVADEEESSLFASSEEDIASSQEIENEVRATLTVSAQLNINFLPNDLVILKKMIAMEFKESELLHRRDGGS